MNEENNKKRNKIIIIVVVLFLLTAGIMTVHSFKNTKAEETDAVVSTSTKATCKGGSNFVFRSDGISGCEMTINTLKNISGFQQQKGNTDNDWKDIKSFTLDTEYGIKMTDKLVRRYNSKYESYSDPWDYPADNNYILNNYSVIDSSTICRSETFCCAFKLSGIDSDESQKFRNKGNFHMIFNYSYPNDSFKGEFVYAFPSADIGNANPSKLTIDYYNYKNNCMYAYNQPLVKVTIDDRGSANTEYYQVSDMSYIEIISGDNTKVIYTDGNVYIKYTPPIRNGYVFDGFDSNDDIVSLSNNYYKLPITSDETAVQNTSLEKTYKMIERKLTVKWRELPSTTVKFNFNVPSNVSSANCICDGLDEICFAFDNNPTEIFDYVVSGGSSIQLPTIRCPGINKKIKDWSGHIGNFKPTANTTLIANWESINSGNPSSSVKYEVVLNKNCSGTFKCVSDENSEVCKGLTSSTGTYTKEVEEGDTFTFPKTFDTLTCDGKKITSWGKYNLGKQVTVNSDITANATWESSSGGGGDDVPTPGPVTYNVTLYRNCVGTFACNSTTKPEICAGLKGTDGKYVEKVNKGDKFVFPNDDDFKLLTCDGKELLSWSKYVLGESVTINSNITANATWASSNGGGDTPDPSQNDDPIDNPQTGSIIIYLVLLFGIGALVYSVWYFRGFREN